MRRSYRYYKSLKDIPKKYIKRLKALSHGTGGRMWPRLRDRNIEGNWGDGAVICFLEDIPIAWGSISFARSNIKQYGIEIDFFVNRKYRNKGIGTVLSKKTKELARKLTKGKYKLNACVSDAPQFFRKNRYRK